MKQTTLLYQLTAGSILKQAISGDVYKFQRPVNSDKEDVVVNPITIDNEMVQSGVANVNIHVPSITTADGVMPNTARLEELEAIGVNLFEYGTGDIYTFYFLSSNTIKEPAKDEWFVNIKVQFKFHTNLLN
jgi:hypothetical protein